MVFDTGRPADHDLISDVEISEELGFAGREEDSSLIVYLPLVKICFISLPKDGGNQLRNSTNYCSISF